MGLNDFRYKEACRALSKLGFTKKHGRGHDKFIAPDSIEILEGMGFIMLPRHKNIHCQKAILKELKIMGGEKLLEDFKSLI